MLATRATVPVVLNPSTICARTTTRSTRPRVECLQEWLTQDLSSIFECLAMLVYLGAKQREHIEYERREARSSTDNSAKGCFLDRRDPTNPRFVWTTPRTLTQIAWIHYTQPYPLGHESEQVARSGTASSASRCAGLAMGAWSGRRRAVVLRFLERVSGCSRQQPTQTRLLTRSPLTFKVTPAALDGAHFLNDKSAPTDPDVD